MRKRVSSLFNRIILTLLLPICLTTILWVWLVQIPIQAHIPDSQASDRDLWRTLNTPFERINQVLEDKEGNIWVVSASSYSITEVLTHTDTITNTTQTSETIKTVEGKGIARFDNGKWITYTVESTNGGLPSDNILSAFFDTKGNLWFGTFTKDPLKGLQGLGVTRFDGQAWHTFTNKDGLAPGVVVDIEEDDQGGLWFVTTTGLSHLKHNRRWESFTDGKILGGKSILDIYRANDGVLWTAASKLKGSGSCLSRYQNGKWYPCEIEGIPFDSVGQLAREKTGRWWVRSFSNTSLILDQSSNPASLDTNIAFFDGKIWHKGGPEESGLTDQFVTKMYQDRNGNLWFGLEHGLIWQESWGWKLTDEFGFEGTSSISDILYDVTDNLVWVATAEGLKYYTGYHRQTFSEDTGDLGSSLLDWFKASDGTIWAGTDRGVSHYQNGAWKTFSVESGDLSNNPARKLFEAKDGAIWALLGSVTGKNSWSWAGGGVSRYQNGKWQNFNVESGYLNSDEVGDLFEASDGTIWARAYKGGVSRYHNGKWETFSVESGDLPDNDVQALAEASDGAIWARTWGGGVSRYQNGNWQTFSGTSGDLGSNKARIWLETSDGVIWIGTSGGGVSRYQDNKWQTFNMDSGDLGGNDVQDLLEAGDGTVWVATTGGVSRYQGGKWQIFNVESGDLGSNDVQDLLEASDGAIWVETEEGGVSRYQGDKWQIFNVESGDLNTNLVSNLFEAKDGAIWVVLCERIGDNSTSS